MPPSLVESPRLIARCRWRLFACIVLASVPLFAYVPSVDLLFRKARLTPLSRATVYTLKCRTEDRYVAAGRDLRPGPKLKHDCKFEEDIGVPFISRFSHSMTVSLDEHEKLAGKKYPETLTVASKLFPGLLTIRRDRLPCLPETVLALEVASAARRFFEGLQYQGLGETRGHHQNPVHVWGKVTHRNSQGSMLSFVAPNPGGR